MDSSVMRGASTPSILRPVVSLKGLRFSQMLRQGRSHVVRVANIAAPPAVKTVNPMAKYKTKKDLASLFEDYAKGYHQVDPATGEREGWCEVIGKIPTELEGTLLRNCPALFERGPIKKVFLDGDGMVASVAIKDGKAYFRNKFVRTPGFVEEQGLGKFSQVSIFTDKDPRPALTGKPVWWHRLVDDIFMGPPSPKHNGAYNVWNWAGTLVAVDFGSPWALDKNNLDTIDSYDVHSKSKFTAHYRILAEPEDGSLRMVCFSPFVDWAKYETTVKFMEFDESGGKVKETTHKFPAAYFHDLIVTDNWYILFDCPISMDYYKTFVGYPSGANSLGDTMTEDLSRPPIFRMFPRRGNGEPKIIPVENFHCYAYHHINGFDVDDRGDKVIFDTCTWDKFSLYFNDIVNPDGEKFFPRTQLSRFEIDTKANTATRELMNAIPSEYPTVAPAATGRPYQHAYMSTSAVGAEGVNGPMQTLTKATVVGDLKDPCASCTLESWLPGEHKFVGEPLFIPRAASKAEDDGWIIVLVHNSEGTPSTEVAILDAAQIRKGPVALLKLPQYLPMGVHGSWSDEYILGPSN